MTINLQNRNDIAIVGGYGYVAVHPDQGVLSMASGGRYQRTIPAGEFKNRCLALMDEVNETGDEIVITKHGRPVSRLVPARKRKPLVGMFRDRLGIAGDIMSPAVPAEDWDSISNPDRVLDPDFLSGR